MKIEVLISGEAAEHIADIIIGVETYSERRGRISFICTELLFNKIYYRLKEKGINPYAVMAWNEI